MKNVNLKLEVTTFNSVLDWQVSLENVVVRQWTTSKNKSEKELENYPVEGDFGFNFIVKGMDGFLGTPKINNEKEEVLKEVLTVRGSQTKKNFTVVSSKLN